MSVGERSVTEAAGSVNRMGENLVPVALLNSNSSVSRFIGLFVQCVLNTCALLRAVDAFPECVNRQIIRSAQALGFSVTLIFTLSVIS